MGIAPRPAPGGVIPFVDGCFFVLDGCFDHVPKTSLPARLIVRAATSALVDVQRRALWRVHPLIRDACEHPVCVGKADH